MRKLFLFMMVSMIAIFTACSSGDDSTIPQKTITNYEETQLSQTIYADETSSDDDFTFTANQAWHTVIESKVKSSEIDWITLDPASGEAGVVNMSINLDTNMTGEDRSALISIVCGETTITITIEQKATTEDGVKPKPIDKALVKNIIVNSELNWQFVYNDDNSLKNFYCTEDIHNNKDVSILNVDFEYTDSEITIDAKILYSTPDISVGETPPSNTDEYVWMTNMSKLSLVNGKVASYTSRHESATTDNTNATFTYDNEKLMAKNYYSNDGEAAFVWQDNLMTNINYISQQGRYDWSLDIKYLDEIANINIDINKLLLIDAETVHGLFWNNLYQPMIPSYFGEYTANLVASASEVKLIDSDKYDSSYRFEYEFNQDGNPIKVKMYETNNSQEELNSVLDIIYYE